MSYDSEVAADSPLVYLELNDTAGTTATDTSGNARHGTYATSSGTGYQLNQTGILDTRADGNVKFVSSAGTDTPPATGYVTVPYGAWTNTTGDMSVEIWYKPPTSGVTGGVLCGHRATALQWQLSLTGSGNFQFIVWDAATLAFQVTAISVGVFDNRKAYHVVGVHSGTSLLLYVDGVLQDTATCPASLVSNTADALGVNSTGSAASQTVIGSMACFALYGSALSASRIAAHYTAGAAKIAFLNQQWQLLAADEMSLATSATATSTATHLAAMNMLCAETPTITGDMAAALKLAISLATSATATSAITPQQYLGVAFLDSASIAQQLTASKFGQIVLSESAAMLGVLTAGQKVSINLADIITAAVIIKAGDEEMVGWIVNPNLSASTALDNYDFTGFGQHKGKHYGIRPDGLYVLEGDTDNGVQIDSFVSLGNRNFNTAKQKRVPHAYIGASTDGRMVLKVIVNGQEYLYAVKNPSTDMAEQRVDIGRGLRSNYWNFELMNREGADFEIDTIKFMPIVLERRI